MVIEFRELTLEDRPEISRRVARAERRFCEYTFGNMYCWGRRYGLRISLSDDLLVIGNPQHRRYLLPIGATEAVREAAEQLLREEGAVITGIGENELSLFDGRFELKENEKRFDYIYLSERLQTLSGKKLAAKRNHINAFLASGAWNVREITAADKDTLLAFNDEWCQRLCKEQNDDLKSELCAAACGIRHFEELGYKGLMLYQNGRLVAYSFGEPVSPDTFCVHVEKADPSVRGAYPMINREFVRAFCGGYLYVNREDDAGDEGLRRAKRSYCPTDVGKKYIAKLR